MTLYVCTFVGVSVCKVVCLYVCVCVNMYFVVVCLYVSMCVKMLVSLSVCMAECV